MEFIKAPVRAAMLAGLLLCAALISPGAQALAQTSAQERREIEETVRSWALAWERSDVQRYLAYYAADFVPPRGLSLEAWRAQRVSRVREGQRVIMLRDLSIISAGTAAEARFTQHYVGKQLLGTSQKRLLLVKRGGEWKIREEQVDEERQIARI
ncbi:L,D-transpeptidase Cds6 family protein [Viridibacterium curvum]|uniref:Cds6 C-terminal domain-containing protein n=1 Tax=Viridibacterium curvum TaxID=1101404 RepID=A0ABP9QTE2_9RHOO